MLLFGPAAVTSRRFSYASQPQMALAAGRHINSKKSQLFSYYDFAAN